MLTEEKKIALARVIERVDRVGWETCNEDVDFLIDNLRETSIYTLVSIMRNCFILKFTQLQRIKAKKELIRIIEYTEFAGCIDLLLDTALFFNDDEMAYLITHANSVHKLSGDLYAYFTNEQLNRLSLRPEFYYSQYEAIQDTIKRFGGMPL